MSKPLLSQKLRLLTVRKELGQNGECINKILTFVPEHFADIGLDNLTISFNPHIRPELDGLVGHLFTFELKERE